MTYRGSEPEVERVRYEVRRFRQHLITYIAVVGVLFIVNVLTGGFWRGHWWFFWVALIWGIFLALQAAHLFGDHIGRDWEDRMVDRVLASRKRATEPPPKTYAPPEPPRPSTAPPAAAGSAPPVPEAGPSSGTITEPIITPPPPSSPPPSESPPDTKPPES